jgi:hypothetical protein
LGRAITLALAGLGVVRFMNHTVHINAAPLMACPLMHLFMHGGHHRGRHGCNAPARAAAARRN